MKRTTFVAAALAVIALGLGGPALAAEGPSKQIKPACDRACLEGFADRYMAALVAHDPDGAPFAENVKFTENNVELAIGDGLWGTINGPATKPLVFADPAHGQVGLFSLVLENEELVYYAMRLKVASGRITEVETIVNRASYGEPHGDPAKYFHEPIMAQVLTPAQRRPRERMIDLANGYFSTLQLNDGNLLTEFDPKCRRIENGQPNSGYPDAKNEVFKMYCPDQFKLGYYNANTRVRDRDYVLVDEEKGLVLARGFIDHAGVNRNVHLTNGQVVKNRGHPHTWCMLELFKIVDGKITQIEAVFFAVPYYMKTPWAVAAAKPERR